MRLNLQTYLAMYAIDDSMMIVVAYSGVNKAAGRGTECSKKQETSASLL